jgi:hypothetical protein
VNDETNLALLPFITHFLFVFLSLVLYKSLSGLSRVDTERPCAVSVSIYLALDMPVKAFVSFMKEKQNCHASISDPGCLAPVAEKTNAKSKVG